MVSIRWVLKDFTDLKRCPSDVSLEFSFITLVIISNGDYFRRVSWDACCQRYINHVVVRNSQRACALLFDQVFSCCHNKINDLDRLVILVGPSITSQPCECKQAIEN